MDTGFRAFCLCGHEYEGPLCWRGYSRNLHSGGHRFWESKFAPARLTLMRASQGSDLTCDDPQVRRSSIAGQAQTLS
jgi:hypothetical protein